MLDRSGMLVLSVFPGAGVLDLGFELEGFTVLRGPDLLWGRNVKGWHPPRGVFGGVIGGPPCQAHSRLVHVVRHRYGPESVAEDLIPEYQRVVAEACPEWFVMENVEGAPVPDVGGYLVDESLLDNRWLGGEQRRLHRFSFGTRDGRRLLYDGLVAFECPEWSPRVLASGGVENRRETGSDGGRWRLRKLGNATRKYLAEGLRLQGLPADFFEGAPYTVAAMVAMVGNAVALPMARAVARAVARAMDLSCKRQLEVCGVGGRRVRGAEAYRGGPGQDWGWSESEGGECPGAV